MEVIDYNTEFGMIGCEIYSLDAGYYRVVPVYYEFERIEGLSELGFNSTYKESIPILLNAIVSNALEKCIAKSLCSYE